MTIETPEATGDFQAHSQSGQTRFRHPSRTDGRKLWRIASDSKVLDVNSSYAYVLWAADFAATSVVGERDGKAIGFITGYRRPRSPSTLVVWQVAVDESERGGGIAAAMLDWLVAAVARPGEVLIVETTVSPSNTASRALFAAFARRENCELEIDPGFAASLFPDAHEAENVLRIGPLAPRRPAPEHWKSL